MTLKKTTVHHIRVHVQ